MPTFTTKEQFSCGHGLETCHKRTGNDRYVITETLPVPLRCLSCICQGLLDSSVDGMPRIPHSRIVELRRDFKVLGQGDISRPLKMVKYHVRNPGNVEEFGTAVLGLAGLPKIRARFLSGQ